MVQIIRLFHAVLFFTYVSVIQVVELQRDPEGEDKRVRATLKKPSKRDKNGASDLHDRVKILSDENIRYKDILEEVSITDLLQSLPNCTTCTCIEFSPVLCILFMVCNVLFHQCPGLKPLRTSVTSSNLVPSVILGHLIFGYQY